MFKEHDIIRSNKKLSLEISENTKGVILQVYDNGEAYLIEFIDADGNTIGSGMDTVNYKDIEPIG